ENFDWWVIDTGCCALDCGLRSRRFWLHLLLCSDGAMLDLFEEDPGWYLRFCGANVGEFVCLFIAFAPNMAQLAPVEAAFHDVVQVAIRNHVICCGIAGFHSLLYHQVRVPVDHQSSAATCFCHPHAMQE